MLPFANGIYGNYTKKSSPLILELRSLRNLQTVQFSIGDQTVINTIKQGFSPILEDYLGDNLPGFGDAFWGMTEHPIPEAGEEREFNLTKNLKMKFCWIPAGEAMLGLPKSEKTRSPNETEQKFKTNGFWMGKYTVTQTQWEAVMGKNPSHFKGANLPVENVSWDGCQEFIEKCNISGLKPRLPCGNQWEYACRGGKGNKQAFYWGDTLNGDKANCNGTGPYGTDKKGAYLEKTSEVGSYEKVAPHPWNLCDMHGNVWEWCRNLYSSLGSYRMVRGGSWLHDSWECRSSKRFWANSINKNNLIGFRLVIF